MSMLMFICIFTLLLWILIDLWSKDPDRNVITMNVILIMLGVLSVYFHWA